MHHSITKIGLFLGIIIILPILFFSYYELSNLNENEKKIEAIYDNQLEAILFSINQYGEDVIRAWINDFKRKSDNPGQTERFKDFFSQHPIIDYAFCANEDTDTVNVFKRPDIKQSYISRSEIRELIGTKTEKINKLKQFFDQGYNKIEPINDTLKKNSQFLFFVVSENSQKRIYGFNINTYQFIQTVLGPKIQRTSEEKFLISVKNTIRDELTYTTDSADAFSDEQIYKSIWLLPGYELGIQLKDETIETLVHKRTRTNMMLIIGLVVILLLGAWLVFKNIKKEIKLARMKSNFISNVSHEIRTPLSMIKMYTETLEMDRITSKEKIKKYHRIIRSETERLTGIVNKILNFSKLESGKKQYNFRKVNINDIVEDIMDSYAFHLKNKGFGYKIDLAEGLPRIQADMDAIHDILINLLDNAIKYSTQNKYITIRTAHVGNFVNLEVADKGPGISEKDQIYIFDKFYRVSKSTLAYQAKGSGLGLTIVKNLVDAHKGKIEVNSVQENGSLFRIKFPLYQENNKYFRKK